MRILYGVQGHYKDVTELAQKHFKYECLCMNNGKYLRIPAQDFKRDKVFGDPIVGTSKHIFLNGEKKSPGVLYINVDLHEKMSPSSNIRKKLQIHSYESSESFAKHKLSLIHNSLALNHSSFSLSTDLQVHCIMYIKQTSKVLFIDENMTTYHVLPVPLVIASVLSDDSNFVVFCDNNEDKIKENRDLNEFSFNVEKVRDSFIDSSFDIIVICNPHKNYKLEDKGYKLKASINTNEIWVI